jgi:hypothetical protein
MSISDKTRKRLWGRSGNRCAISKNELTHDSSEGKPDSILGQECHICSGRPQGPRFTADLDSSLIDEYDNLILLSRDWHKIVDDNPNSYTAERLRQLRKAHEEWVKTALDYQVPDAERDGVPPGEVAIVPRLTKGTQVWDLIATCQAWNIGHDELRDDAEVGLVADLLQDVQGWGEIASEVDAGDAVRTAHAFSKQLQELEDSGLWVFGTSYATTWGSGARALTFQVAFVRVLRTDNPSLIVLTPQS